METCAMEGKQKYALRTGEQFTGYPCISQVQYGLWEKSASKDQV